MFKKNISPKKERKKKMRLSREAVKTREDFCIERFKNGETPSEVQKKLKNTFGHAMRGKRLYELAKTCQNNIKQEGEV